MRNKYIITMKTDEQKIMRWAIFATKHKMRQNAEALTRETLLQP